MDWNQLASEANVRSLFKYKLQSSIFNDIPLHKPPLQACSSPIPRIRIWPISFQPVCSRQKSTFLWRLQIGSPSKFFQWLWASFFEAVKVIFAFLWLLSFCSTFWVFLWTGLHSDCIQQTKGTQSQCRLDWDFLTLGEKEQSVPDSGTLVIGMREPCAVLFVSVSPLVLLSSSQFY